MTLQSSRIAFLLISLSVVLLAACQDDSAGDNSSTPNDTDVEVSDVIDSSDSEVSDTDEGPDDGANADADADATPDGADTAEEDVADSGSSDVEADTDAGAGRDCSCGGPNLAFGSYDTDYTSGTILPDHVGEAELDQAVRDYYDTWKANYLQQACGNGQYVVATGIDGATTVSEAHGYGMLLAALMAGHDPDAKTIFDGMYDYYRDHGSAIDGNLMAWFQDESCNDARGDNSATDGDLDVAYALLLADKQWGSCGSIDYRAEALAMIGSIRDHDVSPSAEWILLGDWVPGSSERFRTSTRTSDHMTGHFATFEAATGNADWDTLVQGSYDVLEDIQTNDSPQTGLVPDFVEDVDTDPKPADNLLEGATDNDYAYNACRVPWRIGTAHLVHGHPRAKQIAERMTSFMKSETSGDPAQIRAVYHLDGTFEGDYSTMAFIAPFGVAAMVDSGNQAWLNALWDTIAGYPSEGYYEDTIKLLSMVVMSGNWWSPEEISCR